MKKILNMNGVPIRPEPQKTNEPVLHKVARDLAANCDILKSAIEELVQVVAAQDIRIQELEKNKEQQQ